MLILSPLAALLTLARTPSPLRVTDTIPPPQATSIVGTWALNKEESDDPFQKIRDANPDAERGRGDGTGGRGEGGRGGGGWGGRGGVGTWNGGRGEAGRQGGPEGQNDQRGRAGSALQLAMGAIQRFAIRRDDSTVTFDYLNGRTLRVAPDGRKVKEYFDGYGELERRALWQAGSLVLERQLGGGGKVTEEYLLSSNGEHLLVLTHVQSPRGEFTFRRVYDPVPST